MVLTFNLKYIVKIMELFRHQPLLQLTIRQISKRTDINYAGTYRTVQQLIKQGILDYNVFGRCVVVSLAKTVRAVGFMAMIESMSKGMGKEDFLNKVNEHAKRIE